MAALLHLEELYNHVKGGDFVWSDVKHKCRKGIRYFSERCYVEKTGKSIDGAHVWRIKKAYVDKLSALR